ncbi:BadF/BadG/BcrA/BcrD ATPase family protein [Paenibacillus harenae]|uniref:Glucosamine kinase n=1 Tax=Paenibacillus harenae TaxID=306543 RepID=A0ABT9U2V0_PAEHA|nr:BadF/BadG/BcrA/BcrD ATPase family protein [Paenibacillus harenae]MDQ0113396.1 glucosamine kinase [Paenibacillus harenae]
MTTIREVVIGIDGGGTYTRVAVADLAGNMLASIVAEGAASIHKDLAAATNVRQAIASAIADAGVAPSQVRGIAAGIAGYDSPADLEWVKQLTDVPGLNCPKWHVNDTVAAHYGALMARPGIIAIAGTGSNIFAITESGQAISNYSFHHYAASAARFIAYDAVYEALAGNTDATDSELLGTMLRHFDCSSLDELALLARNGFEEDARERNRIFGQFAPSLTEAAEGGSSLAILVCNRAIDQMIVGIELLARSFDRGTIPVSFIGSVANSPYFFRALGEKLAHGRNRTYNVAAPMLPPVAGAVLLALSKLGIEFDEESLKQKLSKAG